jgi:hypothetical protein
MLRGWRRKTPSTQRQSSGARWCVQRFASDEISARGERSTRVKISELLRDRELRCGSAMLRTAVIIEARDLV